MKKRILAIAIVLSMMFCSNTAFAKSENSDDWITEKLADYTPLQNLLAEYPDAINISNKTSYILIETQVDNSGNILSKSNKAFETLHEMNTYESSRIKINKLNQLVVPNTVGDGGTTYTYYSKMKIGLSEYKYTSSRFFVACVFQWLTLPVPGTFSTHKLKGVLGLAVNPQLSMINGTYGGRISYTSSWVYGTQIGSSNYMLNHINGGLSIKATGTQGIGFSFSVPHYTGVNYEIVTAMDGVISCEAYKSNPQDSYCSAYGEYANVGTTLSLDSFSVSIPAGISFGLPTVKEDKFTHQDALDIR